MKTFLFIFITILHVFLLKSQNVAIPDTKFKTKLLASDTTNFTAQNLSGMWFKLDANNDGEIQQSEADQVGIINVEGSGISSLEGIKSFKNMHTLYCFSNIISSLDVSNLTKLKVLNCHGNLLTNLNVSGTTSLEDLNCDTNYQLTSLNLAGLINLKKLEVSTTGLTSLNVSGLNLLKELRATYSNALTSINLTNATSLEYVDFSNIPLNSLDVSTNVNINFLILSSTNIVNLDLSKCINLSFFSIFNNLKLNYLNIKNGLIMNPNSGIYENIKLSYVCADDLEIQTVQRQVSSTCLVSSYCTFTPGGNFNTITGNLSTCEAGNYLVKNTRVRIFDGTTTGSSFTNYNGIYKFYTNSGNFTITAQLEHPYFFITPNPALVNFADSNNNYQTRNFCLSPNGIKNDLEIKIFPITRATPGFDAFYKILYTNKGNTIQNGSLNFLYNHNYSTYISSNTNPTSTGLGSLNWNFTNLKPFEERFIDVRLNHNTPTHPTFPLNAGSILNFTSQITVGSDETPADNTFTFVQTLVNSFDPNDKTCLQGNSILPEMIGKYVDYMIKFENTGSAEATFIVVKDIIDTDLFDIETLIPTSSSHDYEVKISESNKVEFYFKDINLPFNDEDNDGFIAFKIKTKSTLKVGDVLRNKADIYFDYNNPIETKDALTKIENLSNEDFSTLDTQASILFSPNPVKDKITFSEEVKNVSIFDLNGKLIQSSIVNGTEMNVSSLQNGNYILKITTKQQTQTNKLVKL